MPQIKLTCPHDNAEQSFPAYAFPTAKQEQAFQAAHEGKKCRLEVWSVNHGSADYPAKCFGTHPLS
jgi:hypothetical protein